MWVLKQGTFLNLGSFEDGTYIPPAGVRIVQGENLSDLGQKSNGSGKSLSTEFLALLLTGEVLRKASPKELIRDGKDFLNVCGEFYNEALNKKMVIGRNFFKSKPQTIALEIDNIVIPLSGVDEYEKRIIKELGISKEDLFNFFIINSDRYVSFFSIGDSRKKEFISRLAGSDVLKGIDKFILKDIQEIDSDLRLCGDTIIKLNQDILNCEANILKNKDFIENGLEVVREQIRNEIENSQLEIEKLSKEQVDYQTEILTINGETRDCNSEINKLSFQIREKEDEIKKISKDNLENIFLTEKIGKIIKGLNEKLDSLYKERNKLSLKLHDFIECPSCHHQFSLKDKDSSVDLIKKAIESIEVKQMETQLEFESCSSDLKATRQLTESSISQMAILNQSIQSLKLLIKTEDNKKEMQERLIQQKLKLIENNKKDIVSYENLIILKKENLEKLTVSHFQIENEELEEKIIRHKLNIELTTNLSSLAQEKKTKTEEWIWVFVKFNTYLSNLVIKSIEGYINMYLDQFQSNLRVGIEGYKILADGKTVREEIAVNIIRDGIDVGAFGKFSKGERMRIVIASILALQTLININSKTGGLNILMLDEVIEAIDSDGLREISKMLSKTGKSIDIISPVENDLVGIPKLIARKENGKSTYIYEDISN